MHPFISPSNIHRRKLCPGSARMELNFPEPADTPEGAEGRLMHAACASEDLDGLAGEAREAAERAMRLRDDAMESVFGEALPDACEFSTEKKLKFHTPDGKPVFGGCADFVALGEKRALIVEYKFGMLPADPAAENLQLSAYACMLAQTERFEGSVFVALIRPRAGRKEALTLAEYTPEDLEDATEKIQAIFDASNRLDAPTRPAEDACRYCRAKLSCPALEKAVRSLPGVPREKLLSLPSEKLGTVMDSIRLAGQIRADVSSEVLRRIENGEMPGWRARSHGSQATVADPREAFSAFQQEFGGNYRYRGESSPSLAEDFMQCVAVEITPLVDLVQRLDGGSMASARQHVENVLGPCLTRTPKSPTPVRG